MPSEYLTKGIREKYKSERTAVENADTLSGTTEIQSRHHLYPSHQPDLERTIILNDNDELYSTPYLLSTVLNYMP